MKDIDILIPREIWSIEELSVKECIVLSIYRYYTVNGNFHYCALSNDEMCKMSRLKDKSHFGKIKKHLKDLGYIRTDGGVKVTYLGVKGNGFKTIDDGFKTIDDGEKTIDDGFKTTHKEDIKNNKEDIKKNKEEGKEADTSSKMKLVMSSLRPYQQTQEVEDYLKEKYIDAINNSDFTVGGVLGMWEERLVKEINRVFPGLNNTKPVKKSELHNKPKTNDSWYDN